MARAPILPMPGDGLLGTDGAVCGDGDAVDAGGAGVVGWVGVGLADFGATRRCGAGFAGGFVSTFGSGSGRGGGGTGSARLSSGGGAGGGSGSGAVSAGGGGEGSGAGALIASFCGAAISTTPISSGGGRWTR